MTSEADLLFKTDWSTDSRSPFSLQRSHPKATVRGALIQGCVVYCETQLQVEAEHPYFTGWKTIDLHSNWQTVFVAGPVGFRFNFPAGIAPTDLATITTYDLPRSSGLRALRDLPWIEDTVKKLGPFLRTKGVTRTVIFPDPIDIRDNGASPSLGAAAGGCDAHKVLSMGEKKVDGAEQEPRRSRCRPGRPTDPSSLSRARPRLYMRNLSKLPWLSFTLGPMTFPELQTKTPAKLPFRILLSTAPASSASSAI